MNEHEEYRDVMYYGLYEDFYEAVVFSVEDAYEEYWNEVNGED